MFKKYFRLFLRVFLLITFGITMYFLNLHYMFMQEGSVFLAEKASMLKLEPSAVTKTMSNSNLSFIFSSVSESPKVKNNTGTILEDFIFDKDDMVNENKQPFHIMIWNRHSGVPGYVANPKECMGNISCRVTYINNEVEKAHAIVFPAGRTRDFPSTR